MDWHLDSEIVSQIQTYTLFAVVMLASLTIHEFAHARIALAFGDPTAYRLGRVSLNPIRHLDPMGTIAFVLTQVGWGKAVPVNIYLMRPPGLGNICTSAGGPLSNLAFAIIGICGLKILLVMQTHHVIEFAGFYHLLWTFLWLTFTVNIGLFLFNLIPLYPLDGHHILGEFFPRHMQEGFMRWQLSYGMYLMIALWIGPRVLRQLTGQNDTPNPVGWGISFVIGQISALVGV